jgi:uncharacterized iron-regulated membrane protein
MSLTGVLLMYERQLIEWSDRAFRSTPTTPDAKRLPVETLIATVQGHHSGSAPTAVTLRSDRTAPASISFAEGTVYADVYNGQILGAPTTRVRQFMTTMRSWHRWIAVEGDGRTVTKAITGWSNLVFLFIVLSGMYLWIPRVWEWSRIRGVVFFRGGLRGKARDFNWHNVIGIWCSVPLAFVVATATPISFPWANALLFRAVGETPPPPAGAATAAPPAQNGGAPERARGERTGSPEQFVNLDHLDDLWARAEAQVDGWRSITVRLPPKPAATLAFAIDRGNGGQPQERSTLTLDASANVARWEPFASQSLGRRLRSWSRFIHTGEAFGIGGQTVAGIASGGAVVLVWTT